MATKKTAKKTTKTATKKTSKPVTQTPKPKQKDNTLAIVGLILNLILLPGLGSIVGGKIKEGIWQLVILFGSVLLSLILFVTIIGIPVAILLIIGGPIAAWVWGLITGIQMIKENS